MLWINRIDKSISPITAPPPCSLCLPFLSASQVHALGPLHLLFPLPGLDVHQACSFTSFRSLFICHLSEKPFLTVLCKIGLALYFLSPFHRPIGTWRIWLHSINLHALFFCLDRLSCVSLFSHSRDQSPSSPLFGPFPFPRTGFTGWVQRMDAERYKEVEIKQKTEGLGDRTPG